ncbi:hypothetical protein [Intestinibaculum porci]|uniref:hypothetical protein n=1 Tax=Intestinibaculum porci TaxID=2487118 RepID=UPI002409B217|nr:hypothetical protein [Intestinibaculum porci]MDD6350421.1 hypothetical protein [Intestinibaculum porci]MDD6422348.1 hypothetical protein [Intestinibaculum porci]
MRRFFVLIMPIVLSTFSLTPVQAKKQMSITLYQYAQVNNSVKKWEKGQLPTSKVKTDPTSKDVYTKGKLFKIKGITLSKDRKTLTLNNINRPHDELMISQLSTDFKIVLRGTNRLRSLFVIAANKKAALTIAAKQNGTLLCDDQQDVFFGSRAARLYLRNMKSVHIENNVNMHLYHHNRDLSTLISYAYPKTGSGLQIDGTLTTSGRVYRKLDQSPAHTSQTMHYLSYGDAYNDDDTGYTLPYSLTIAPRKA